MKLSIIIPVFNESKTIRTVLSLLENNKLPSGWEKEIIIVDDKSTDGTTDLLRTLDNKYIIKFREKNGGKGTALKDGLKIATGDYVIIQDADLEYNPNDFSKLLKPIQDKKAEIVFGSRIIGNKKINKSIYYFGGVFLNIFFNLLFKTKISDITTCYKVFPKRYNDVLIKQKLGGFVFDAVDMTFILSKNENIMEIPIEYNPRNKEGGKKIGWGDGFVCLYRMCVLYLKHGSHHKNKK